MQAPLNYLRSANGRGGTHKYVKDNVDGKKKKGETGVSIWLCSGKIFQLGGDLD